MSNEFDMNVAAAIRYDITYDKEETTNGWKSLSFLMRCRSYSAPLGKFSPYVFMALRLNKIKAFKFLIEEQGINPNITDENGDTLIIFATRLNNIELMKVLLAQKAEPCFKNKIGKNAFDYICSQEACDLLAEHHLSKKEFGELTYRLHEKAMMIGLDESARILRSIATKLDNEDAKRIESYAGRFFQNGVESKNNEASTSANTQPSSEAHPSVPDH